MITLEQNFSQKIAELIEAFESAERPDESDIELADSILEFVLSYERLRHQVTAGTEKAKAADEQTIFNMKTWDSDDPAMSTIEKVFRRLVEGRGEEGIQLLKAAIQTKVDELSNRQAALAKKPRLSRRQPMSGLVEQIVQQDPKISEHDLSLALKRCLLDMTDPPYKYSSMSFKSIDPKFPDVKNSSIGDFLYRARKKIPS